MAKQFGILKDIYSFMVFSIIHWLNVHRMCITVQTCTAVSKFIKDKANQQQNLLKHSCIFMLTHGSWHQSCVVGCQVVATKDVYTKSTGILKGSSVESSANISV